MEDGSVLRLGNIKIILLKVKKKNFKFFAFKIQDKIMEFFSSTSKDLVRKKRFLFNFTIFGAPTQ